jgi:hypothetical protein
MPEREVRVPDCSCCERKQLLVILPHEGELLADLARRGTRKVNTAGEINPQLSEWA